MAVSKKISPRFQRPLLLVNIGQLLTLRTTSANAGPRRGPDLRELGIIEDAAVLCLGLYTASRVAEQVRSGIESLPRGQTNAGLAMGFTLPQVYRYVLLPMAYRLIVPPMTSEFLTIFKNSSTALVIGVMELTAQARQINEYTFRTFEAFTAATLLYVIITLTVIFAMRWLEHKVAVPGYVSQGGH